MEFKSKFNMTREDNIFFVKRNIVDFLWKSARLEGIAATFPQTQEIYEGRTVQGLDIFDTLQINNIKRGWQLVLGNIDAEMCYSLICTIHKTIGEGGVVQHPGQLKKYPNYVGDYVPPMPMESKIKEEIADILSIENATDRALTMMTYLMRQQMFSDGNKRTATLVANHILVANGEGVISIPTDKFLEFSDKTMEYYHSGDDKNLKKFLYDECLKGN